MQNLELIDLVITARKRSLGQGNLFTGVCLSTEEYDVTSCPAAWSDPMFHRGGGRGSGLPGGLPCGAKGGILG